MYEEKRAFVRGSPNKQWIATPLPLLKVDRVVVYRTFITTKIVKIVFAFLL